MDFFRNDLPFFKGNLHMHTTRSDGELSPEDALALYRAHGYDFVALTDHDLIGAPNEMRQGMLVLSGMELEYELPGEEMHLVGVGMSQDAQAEMNPHYGPQYAIDVLRKHGGRVIVAHPAWSLLSHTTLSGLRGITAAEIYNSMSTMPRNCLRADASLILDVASAHGCVLPLVAADDSHFYDVEYCKSYVMVQAEELTAPAILQALDERRFYASQGPEIRQWHIDRDEIVVECSPVDTILFYSNLPWVTGRCRQGHDMTRSVYTLGTQSGESFVRCQVIDREGRSAWTSPIDLTKN